MKTQRRLSNLRISNIVLTGRMPFKHKLNQKEVGRLIKHSKLNWMIINEEISPILSIDIIKKEKLYNVHHKIKRAHVSVWTTGAINIVGVQSKSEGEDIYIKVLAEIKKYCKRVFE